MSVLEWRSCEFYELALFSNFCKVDKQSEIVAHCTNGSLYIFCEALGIIHVCFRNSWAINFRCPCSKLRFCALTTKNEFLVLVAEGESASSINVHVLNLAGISKRTGAALVGSAQLTTHGCVTSLKACLSIGGLLCISIGLDTGELLFHLSVINSDMTSNFITFPSCKSRIIGIEFQQKMDVLYMFVCSEYNVRLYHIINSNIINTETIMESSTTAISCCTFQHNAENSYFLIGRDDAVYCFTIDGRGPCYAISGRKKVIACLKSNIVILMESEEKPLSYIIIIDIYKKTIVFQKDIEKSNNNMLVTNELFCYILNDNNIYITIEKSIQCKLQILMNSNLYELALNEINNRRLSLTGSVLLKYGDYLLRKGDVSSAVNKYKQTIGLMNSYFIIKKLVDLKYNSQLLQYISNFVTTDTASATQRELFENCKKRINISLKCNNAANEICCDNKLPKTLLTFLNNVDAILKEPSDHSFNNTFDDQLIGNCPRINSTYWQKIFKALKMVKTPERYISLLIDSNENCTKFLEHLLSLSNQSTLVFNLLLEVHLFEWQKGRRSAPDIIKLLENYGTGYSEQIVISFVNYSFWPGIIYLHEKYKKMKLSLKYCVKYCDFNIPFKFEKESYIIGPNMMMQAFDVINCSSQIKIDFVDKIIGTMLSERNQAMLQVAQGISIRKNYKVVHIKKLFCTNKSENDNKSKYKIKPLVFCLKSLNAYLLKFRTCPVEFRENICVICKCSLTLPAIYFLCQHAFHVGCVEHNLYGNTCPFCLPQEDNQ
ncbi:vacuolar protein sorting-associated protein 11 homolog [Anastrepha ludens]|uniref:vacuolar protein sorting-associated protein 11 homolog n=1 Tax=Anastrepha ludens TaxID=28586 RepID=UPI0023AF3E4E|nr:vacuolar protein sorting-associated protein 11 homolog [Anastrepha ludens]